MPEVKQTLREMYTCCWTCWMLQVTAFGLILTVLAGCAFLIQPTAAIDIATYNNQVFQIVMALISLVSTLLGFVGLWLKSTRDKKEITEKATTAVEEKTQALEQKVQEVVDQTKRAPARSTDPH